MSYRIESLPAIELKKLLGSDMAQLSEQQVVAIQDFIVRVGGIENAKRAVEMLGDLEKEAA